MPTKMPEVHEEHLVDKDNIPANKSGNRPFTDVLQAHMSRRKVLTGSLAVAGATFLAPATVSALGRGVGLGTAPGKTKDGLVGFEPLSIEEATAGEGRMVTVSPDYEYQTLIPWGTPIKPEVPEYTGTTTRPAARDAVDQIGIGHDGMWFFPATTGWGRQSNKRGILCINHEFGRNSHVLGKSAPENLEDVRLSQAVHGVSVVEIEEKGGKWDVVLDSPYNRRITPNTEMEFSGPVSFEQGSLIYDEGAIPLGTVNNCGSGPTPWGTYVTCEENFDGYFGVDINSTNSWTQTPEQDRYSVSDDRGRYGWCDYDPRFDLSNPAYANEHRRFGWCVEIDPNDPEKKPIKRTAMGRFKHESAAFAELADGRVAVYMGDDQRFDYCYKYVSELPWREHVAKGESPLDYGTLYVARFDEGGTGEWLELSTLNPALSSGWTQEEILVFSRLAADAVGATPMDRPEWTTIGKDGEVYWTLTNNTERTVTDAANPEAPNPDGHIIRTEDTSDTFFDWEIFILAKDTRGTENVFTDPDAAWADPFGRLFIGTDGGQPDGLQDQMVVFDAETREYKRLLMGVRNDEITGITTTPNYRTMFTNTQHPGDGNPSRTNFPAPFDGVTIPRDCTIVVTRKNKGIVGS